MKVLIQWSLTLPQDWVEIDLTPTGRGARAWRDLPRKPLPVGGELIDNTPGWIYDVAIQGIWMGGVDHITAEPMAGGGIKVTAWNDDPDDYPAGTRWARVMTFAPDFTQTKTYYAEPMASVMNLGPHVHSGPNGAASQVQFLPWSEFVVPSTPALHGVWLPSALNDLHASVRSTPDWRRWL